MICRQHLPANFTHPESAPQVHCHRLSILLSSFKTSMLGFDSFLASGMETTAKCPQGLWAQSATYLLDFMAANGFNAIRIPLCAQFCLNLDDTTAMPSGFDTSKNPSLVVSPGRHAIGKKQEMYPRHAMSCPIRNKEKPLCWRQSA